MWAVLESSLRMSTPLIFAAMGGFLCERAGIATICLEGVMLMAAWAAAVTNFYSHSPMLGIAAGALAGSLMMLLHATLTVRLKTDQIVSGVAINLLAAGLTPTLTKFLFQSPTNTGPIPLTDRLGQWHFFEGFSLSPLILVALLLPFLLHWMAYSTGLGIRLQAAGDAPDALSSVGVSPNRVRWWALGFGGILAAFGGTFLSIAHSSQFTRDMTAGRGFIALAALIFGKWRPLPTLAACLLFGIADATQIQIQTWEGIGQAVPVQFIQSLPYVITLLVLVGFLGKARAPLAIGTH